MFPATAFLAHLFLIPYDTSPSQVHRPPSHAQVYSAVRIECVLTPLAGAEMEEVDLTPALLTVTIEVDPSELTVVVVEVDVLSR